jgi:uncharacterized protein (TIRG00374 family)
MRSKKAYLSYFRYAIGIALAALLLYRIVQSSGDGLWVTIYQAKLPLLFTALMLHGVVACVASFRWNLLLKVQGIFLPAWEIVRLTFIGIFFNLGIPGAVSGDFVKMYLLTRNTKGQKDEAILTIILDRVLGLIGLFIVAVVAVILSMPVFTSINQDTYIIKIIAYTVGTGSLAGMAFLTLIELRQKIMRIPFFIAISKFLQRTIPSTIVYHLARIIDALELYRQHRKSLFAAIGLSIFIHSTLAINLYCIGVSIGENTLRLSNYFLIGPVANAVAAVPLTPGGIGTRDATIAMFLSALNVSAEKAGAVPVIMTSIILFWGLVGCMIFILTKRQTYKSRNRREAIRTDGKFEY